MTKKAILIASPLIASALGLLAGLLMAPTALLAQEDNRASQPAITFSVKKSASKNAGTATRHGIFQDKIIFGQAAALKGPAAALGLGMKNRHKHRFCRTKQDGRRAWPHIAADQL